MGRSYYARTVAQIIDGAFRLCQDFRISGGDGRVWRYAEVLDDLNFTLIDLAKNTGILRGIGVIPLQVNVNIYDLPSDCVRPIRFALHGLEGTVLTPTTVTTYDLRRESRTPTGDPTTFFREFLEPNQVGFFPIPSQDGSEFTRDATHGLLRKVTDADGNIPYDADGPLRRIRGLPFTRGGTSRIIRETISPYGNVQVWYVRLPEKLDRQDQYPDKGIPEFIHMWLRYGVAMRMCMYSRKKIHQEKLQRFGLIWRMVVNRVKRIGQWTGPVKDVRPL
jgi:hypothetical protein